MELMVLFGTVCVADRVVEGTVWCFIELLIHVIGQLSWRVLLLSY
jgi:hypothetical protein